MSDINIGQITEALNDKADRDAGNFDSAGKVVIVKFGMPDYANGVSISATSYTAPSDGWISIGGNIGDSAVDLWVKVNDVNVQYFRGWTGSWAGTTFSMFFPVSAGDVITNLSYGTKKFFPCKL